MIDWKGSLRLMLHAFVSAVVVSAAATVETGAPITSGAVLIPAITAGALAALHAALPSPVKNGNGSKP